MTKEQEQKVKEIRERFDKIVGEYATPTFVEVMGRCGSDFLTYRVYKNGTVTER